MLLEASGLLGTYLLREEECTRIKSNLTDMIGDNRGINSNITTSSYCLVKSLPYVLVRCNIRVVAVKWATSQIISVSNLVEAHCYGIGRTGQIVEQSRSSEKQIEMQTFRPRRSSSVQCRRFDCEVLRQLQCIVTDEDLRGRNVYISICFSLLRDCSTICLVLRI